MIKENIKLKDILRVYHGDGPATQLEAGQQKGGHYFCASCGIHADRCCEIAHSYYMKCITLKEKLSNVMRGKHSKLVKLHIVHITY